MSLLLHEALDRLSAPTSERGIVVEGILAKRASGDVSRSVVVVVAHGWPVNDMGEPRTAETFSWTTLYTINSIPFSYMYFEF